MRRNHFVILSPLAVASLASVPPLAAQAVLPDALPGDTTPGTMIRDSLLRQVRQHADRWEQRYVQRTDLGEIAAYQSEMRQFFIDQIGGFPQRGELNPQITGRIERDGYTVEKVLFESLPNFYVTGGLFLPDPERFPPPWPAVVVVCGHSNDGKLNDGYQRGTALAALNGIAGFIVDPISQGERKQVLNEEGRAAVAGSTTEHTLLGTGAILLGWNTARWEIWDAMRAIDFLQSRDDIVAERIGCMGNSGGGTQTSYMMALDERVAAAAPSCYLTSMERLLETIGPQDAEQNIHGQIAFGMDHADYVMMRAPRPTLMACATNDFFDIQGTWQAFRHAKRLYTRFGAGRHVELVEVDAGHGWHPLLRQASVAFMVQHLADRLGEVREPEIEVLSAEEFQVSPTGQVLQIEGAVSTFDHLRIENQRLAEQRQRHRSELNDAAWRQQVRTVAGIRPLGELPKPPVETHEPKTDGDLIYQPLVFEVEEDLLLPAVLVRRGSGSETTSGTATCVLHADGKEAALREGGVVAQRAGAGQTVLAIDVRGVGETRPTGKAWYDERFGRNGGNATIAYLLGQSYVGLRGEDVLRAARFLADSENLSQVDLVATGELTVPALHAAALEPELFGSIELQGGITSWTNVVETPLSRDQIPNVVHGALRLYDLPDLAASLGDRLTITDPRDAAGEPVDGDRSP